jgi:hypothetical protein
MSINTLHKGDDDDDDDNNNNNNIFHLPWIHYKVKDQLDVEVVKVH